MNSSDSESTIEDDSSLDTFTETKFVSEPKKTFIQILGKSEYIQRYFNSDRPNKISSLGKNAYPYDQDGNAQNKYQNSLPNKKDCSEDIAVPTCFTDGCNKPATYNFPRERPAFCEQCAAPDMKPVPIWYCTAPGCHELASFGPSPGVISHCALHRAKDAQFVANQKVELLCIEPDCLNQAKFGYSNSTHCKRHALNDMIKFREAERCIYPGCSTFAWKKINGARVFCKRHF